MPNVKLTTKYLESLQGRDKPYEIADAYCPGLRVTVRPTGKHSFVFRGYINGKAKKYTLGQFPRHSLADAREWAMNVGRNRDLGIDVIEDAKVHEQEERKRRERDCDWLFDQYMTNEGGRRRSAGEKRRQYERDIKPFLGSRSYLDITHNDLAKILQAKMLVAPSMSNALQSLIRRWFRWAVTKGRHISDLTIDPAADLTKLDELRTRERSLNDGEIRLLLEVLSARDTPFREPLLLILHTGVRRAEAFEMRWSEIDLSRGEWLIPKRRTKNNIDLLLPLPDVMLQMFKVKEERRRKGVDLVWPSRSDPDRGMSGFSKITKTLNDDMAARATAEGQAIEPWSIHDLRRTLVSGMNGLLDAHDRPIIQPHVVERVVNHKLPGLQGVYNRHTYYAEKKAALKAWAEHLARLQALGFHG